MRVCVDKCRTVEEELEYIDKQLDSIGNFFVCDVHPNIVRTYHISFHRLCRKRAALIQSAEYQYYVLSNYPDSRIDWLPLEVQEKMDPYKE